MVERMTCPGCGRSVRVFPPRTKGGRWKSPWRRQQHYTDTGLRCRHPVILTEDELVVLLIKRLAARN